MTKKEALLQAEAAIEFALKKLEDEYGIRAFGVRVMSTPGETPMVSIIPDRNHSKNKNV